MLIGRLPVNSLAETQTVVGKIVDYESFPAYGGWNGVVTLVADDQDAAGDFSGMLETIATGFVPAPYTPDRIYYNPPTTSLTTFQQDVLGRLNNGSGLVMFAGHSSILQWAAENFFHLNDVATLNNGIRLPVVMGMTCFTGSFQEPGFSTLDEELVRHPNGGAAAAWGATGLGVSTGHDELAQGFMKSIYIDQNTEIGLAVLAGKLRLANNAPAWKDLLDTFTLLGDPAMGVKVEMTVPAAVIFLPLVLR